MSSYEIVLLGANIGGIPLAHYLLQHTIPRLNAIDKLRKYHLTIIAPNSHYHFKIAAPRALVDEKQIPSSAIIHPISEILGRYPSSDYQHILGRATKVDPSTKTVSVSLNDGSQRSIPYNSLIISTGVHYESPMYTAEHPTEQLKAALSKLHSSLPKAKTIAIAGGGPVGVETAGELATSYPSATITLYSGNTRLLERNVNEKISAEAERLLKSVKVNVVHNVRVKDAPVTIGEPTTLKLADGSEKKVDVYINAIAARKNTDFLPESWLEKNGSVSAEKDSLRATGPGAEDVYVLGDANAHSNGQSMWAADGVRPLASALAIDVLKHMEANEKAAAVKASSTSKGLLGMLGFGGSDGFGSELAPFKTMFGIFVPIAKSGTGLLPGGIKAPGFMVHMIKGKSFLVDFQKPVLSGEVAEKA